MGTPAILAWRFSWSFSINMCRGRTISVQNRFDYVDDSARRGRARFSDADGCIMKAFLDISRTPYVASCQHFPRAGGYPLLVFRVPVVVSCLNILHSGGHVM